MRGDRLSDLVAFESLKLAAGVSCFRPFCRCCSWGRSTARLPRSCTSSPRRPRAGRGGAGGRRRSSPPSAGRARSPIPRTRVRSCAPVGSGAPESGNHALLLAFYRELIRIRKTDPVLSRTDREGMKVTPFEEEKALVVLRRKGPRKPRRCSISETRRYPFLSLPGGRWEKFWIPPTPGGGDPGGRLRTAGPARETVLASGRVFLLLSNSRQGGPLMDRYVCIHCHFYQPPRENPWLEAIELQDSAYPYHDWNERISAECYGPNAFSRTLDGDGRIEKIVNNYARISFNFGPTLLSWMEENPPRCTAPSWRRPGEPRGVLGHGSALAQAYNHTILPLANARDKETQVLWGIRDFKHRFGRPPEGMWLPETAVDLETLEVLAERGSGSRSSPPARPPRCARTGAATGTTSATAGSIPRPVRAICRRSGRSPSSSTTGPSRKASPSKAPRQRGVPRQPPDGSVLRRAAVAAAAGPHRHRRGIVRPPPHPRRDGPCVRAAPPRRNPEVRVTNYGEFLEQSRPPTRCRSREHRLELFHGVERWRSDCGCNSGGRPAGIRVGADRCGKRWTGCGTDRAALRRGRGEVLQGPLGGRDEYISVILDRSDDSVDGFPRKARGRELTPERKTGAPADGDAAARHAHVHELRLVLRRALRHRDGAGPPVRRPRRSACREIFGDPSKPGSWSGSSAPKATYRNTRTDAPCTTSS